MSSKRNHLLNFPSAVSPLPMADTALSPPTPTAMASALHISARCTARPSPAIPPAAFHTSPSISQRDGSPSDHQRSQRSDCCPNHFSQQSRQHDLDLHWQRSSLFLSPSIQAAAFREGAGPDWDAIRKLLDHPDDHPVLGSWSWSYLPSFCHLTSSRASRPVTCMFCYLYKKRGEEWGN